MNLSEDNTFTTDFDSSRFFVQWLTYNVNKLIKRFNATYLRLSEKIVGQCKNLRIMLITKIVF